MPRGTDTYKGLGLPAQGNVNFKQSSESTGDAFTITMSSRGGGNMLVMRNAPSTQNADGGLDSTSLTQDQIRFTTLAALQWTSNNTVVQTISTAGIVGGAESTAQEWSVDSSGRKLGLKATATTLSTASTAVTIATTQSGSILLSNGMSSGLTITLPLSSVSLGIDFTIIQTTGHTSRAMAVSCTGGTGADILLPRGANSTLPSTGQTVAPLSTFTGHMARFIAISSARWLCVPGLNALDGTSVTGETGGGWGTTSTIA